MRLPEMRCGDGLTKSAQVRFGGYDHRPGAGDGTLWDMENLTGDQFPLLAVRRPRRLDRELEQPGGLWAHNALCWVDGDGFFCDGKRVGTVTPGRKQFAGMGSRILIWPDKAVYDTSTGRFERLEASVSLTGVSFRNGTLYGEEAERNTLYCAGADFREGAVLIAQLSNSMQHIGFQTGPSLSSNLRSHAFKSAGYVIFIFSGSPRTIFTFQPRL